ncbi:hypothetical protein FISHEDRAFT_77255 [Fistulina hepatica ATCC 64428]|uniref:DUF6699 domain-containing protein n=1 Tax=Fistulina hepatica ATCC 64428 TaxID=1128425 RepID=A0A0D7A400_9AGAR|nr:hypothetical protein FISHEDRAFT_77255 [Fistulina hepatica ATCC 64428]
MSTPYTYSPGYPSHAYLPPVRAYSPFIPDPASPYYSPYHNTSPLPPASPHTVPIDFPAHTQNTPSWGAQYANQQWLSPAPASYHHHRRHSTGLSPYYPNPAMLGPLWSPSASSPWYNHLAPGSSPMSMPLQIHPLLDGQRGQAPVQFDFSHATFSATRMSSVGQSVMLTPQELGDQATWPFTTRLHVVIESMPQWPLVIEYTGPRVEGQAQPPITIGDVLGAVHRHLHTQVTQTEWNSLHAQDRTEITLAFQKRCSRYPANIVYAVRCQGVKRVDFLRGHWLFRGLVPFVNGDAVKLLTY